jgi:hypothetical protein
MDSLAPIAQEAQPPALGLDPSPAAATAASQSITTVAIVGQVTLAHSTEELVRLTAKRCVFTAKRSVFAAAELDQFGAGPNDPVKVIDFLLVGPAEHPIALGVLVSMGVSSLLNRSQACRRHNISR